MTQRQADEWDWAAQRRPLQFSVNELLLMDWAICAYSRMIPDASLTDLVISWGSLRQQVWSHLSKVNVNVMSNESKGQPDYTFEMSEGDAKALFAVLPTTHRWGNAGEDCGFSLKSKLYQFITNDYPVVEVRDNAATSADETKD